MSESIPSSGIPYDVDAECQALLQPLEGDSEILGWVGWLEEGDREELRTVFDGIDRIVRRRVFLVGFKEAWPEYEHPKYIMQVATNNSSPFAKASESQPVITDSHVVNKLVDLIIESVARDGREDDEQIEQGFQDAEKINMAATIYNSCGKQSLWLLRMVDFQNPNGVDVVSMSETEIEVQHFLNQGLALDEYAHAMVLEEFLKQKSFDLMEGKLKQDFPDILSRETLCEIITFASVWKIIDEYQRGSGTSTPEALTVADKRTEMAELTLNNMLNVLLVFEEFDKNDVITRLRPYLEQVTKIVRIGWLLKRDPNTAFDDEDSALAREWYGGFLVDIPDETFGYSYVDSDNQYAVMSVREDKDDSATITANFNAIEMLAADEFIERFTLINPPFDLTLAAENIYGTDTISMAEGQEIDPTEMLELFVCEQISAYETLLHSEEIVGLPLILRAKREQYKEAASLSRDYCEDTFWLLRIVDDIYSETTGVLTTVLSPGQMDAVYLAEFGRAPAEEDYFGDLIWGDGFEDRLDEALDSASRYFPEDVDVDLQRDFVAHHLQVEAVHARRAWEATRICSDETMQVREAVDRLMLIDYKEGAAAANEKFSLQYRKRLMRVIKAKAEVFGKEVGASLLEAFGIAA